VVKRLAPMFVLGALVVLAPVAGARTTGTLTLAHAVLAGGVNQVDCPIGTDPTAACFQISGTGIVPGLGVVSDQYLLVVEDPDSSCERWHSSPVLKVRGKGTIDLSVRPPSGCVVPTTGVNNGSLVFTVTGGSGAYAGASGQGTFETRGGPGSTGRNTDTLGGSLTVAGLVFDRTPPVLSGAISKTVQAPKGSSTVRVTYKIIARDPGHGALGVSCKPRSGSRFKLGRTRVVCSAVDDSGNKATAGFTITVKRHR
jgi:hypothetical protein